MRGLGKLLTALNPLDQSMSQQIMKSTAGHGMFKRGLAFAGAGVRQVAGGGYFRGINAAAPGKMGSGFARSPAGRADARSTRMAVGGIGAAWAGLNFLAPNSALTTMGNYGMALGATAAAGPSVQSRFGNRGRNIMYGGVGGLLGAKLFGVI